MQASSWSWSLFLGFVFFAAISAQAANSGAPSAASRVDVVRHTCAQSEIANVLRRSGLYFGSRPPGRSWSASVQPIRTNTCNPAVARAANAYLENPSSATMASFLMAVREAPDVYVARADLFNRAVGVLRKHAAMPELTLREAAERYQTLFRYRGRPVGRRRLIGTTLLVKGLEFHNAIVLDAQSLSRKELYVALTRGAKSLTVISTSRTLNPPD